MSELNRDAEQQDAENFIARLRARLAEERADDHPSVSTTVNMTRLVHGFTAVMHRLSEPASLEQRARILEALVDLAAIGLRIAQGLGALK